MGPVARAIAIAEADIDAGRAPTALREGWVRLRPDGTTRGSYVEGVDSWPATRALLEGLAWELVADGLDGAETPGVAHYRARLAPFVGRTGVARLGDLPVGAQIELREGLHGPELVAPLAGRSLPETDEVWALVDLATGALPTWFPGPLAPLDTRGAVPVWERWRRGEAIPAEERVRLDRLAVKLVP